MSAALDALITRAPLNLLQAASAAPTGAGSTAMILSRLPEANPLLAAADPETVAIARAAALKQRLLEMVATLATAEVARQLGISEVGVRRARARGRLLAVEHGGQRYPAFQFTEDGAIRPSMREVLAALAACRPKAIGCSSTSPARQTRSRIGAAWPI